VGKSGNAATKSEGLATPEDDDTDEGEEMEDGGMKIKRMRVGSPDRKESDTNNGVQTKAHRVTKWDRRRSVLPRESILIFLWVILEG